ncbi:fumarylacetoacetate hydrolase family protein [Pseudozobellia thermophila]|uniref:2-dehydro-3-deoxy-D-arabinonate dehydratase n=1 Tax=Pseudozobellia thermophila TaxID=192903 RepID=A0A1M6F2E2_9FLAO|nr:fumarylacetoacetate hydrolase family protein [Pseudozobellia thermophila]SHI91789.1 2-dehydro-3-deoxy-D-arabinonate dehydratase [Pseudozobellia thermophila]
MKIYKTSHGAVIEHNEKMYVKKIGDWDVFLNREHLFQALESDLGSFDDFKGTIGDADIEKPMGNQEVWASGVTYMRSKTARMEESKKAGGGTFYDRVYDADRPELFFKATPQRTVGQGGTVRIRKDSGWDVPEPELTLLISSKGSIEGYTIGNDMSSRSIEGENPLYLPQAKTYDGCAALGPCIYVPGEPISPDTTIELEIIRGGDQVFNDKIQINQMKRKHTDLVAYLFRECHFPNGCFLMTGTGIIPPDEFTLKPGDEIRISIDHIGTLVNFVG